MIAEVVRLRLILAAAEAPPAVARELRAAVAACDEAGGGALPVLRYLCVELADRDAEGRAEWKRERKASRRDAAQTLAAALDAAFPILAAAWASCGRKGRAKVKARAEELLPPELRRGGYARCWASRTRWSTPNGCSRRVLPSRLRPARPPCGAKHDRLAGRQGRALDVGNRDPTLDRADRTEPAQAGRQMSGVGPEWRRARGRLQPPRARRCYEQEEGIEGV